MATLRVRDSGEPDFQEHLRTAFLALFDIYQGGYFDVSTTCNVVLQSNLDQRYSVFYGQDFSDNSYNLGEAQTVRNLGDVAQLQADFDVNDFEGVFFANFENTEVSVHSIINIVWVITRYLDNFERDKTVGRQLTRLY